MAKLIEFKVTRDIVTRITTDMNLKPISDGDKDLVDNLMGAFDHPTSFQKVSMDQKPMFYVRVGKVATEKFEGEGLHVFTHSGSEGYLRTEEFQKRLESSLDRQGIHYKDRS